MDIAQRIKQIRKVYGLTQADFGKRIMVAENTVSQYETGRRALNERTLSTICRAFHVNERWLYTGEGEMFVRDGEDAALEQFISNYGLGEFDRIIIKKYAQLDVVGREAVRKFLESLIEEYGLDLITTESQASAEAVIVRDPGDKSK